mgnify:CR=1 FL=1
MTKHVLKRMIGVVLCLCLLLQLLPQAQNVLAASSKVETALDWAQKIQMIIVMGIHNNIEMDQIMIVLHM